MSPPHLYGEKKYESHQEARFPPLDHIQKNVGTEQFFSIILDNYQESQYTTIKHFVCLCGNQNTPTRSGRRKKNI